MIVGLVLVAGVVGWRVMRIPDLAVIGAGYAALQTCSCLFISKRTPQSCHRDLERLAQRVVSVTAGTDEVTATAFGFSHATANYDPRLGCSLRN